MKIEIRYLRPDDSRAEISRVYEAAWKYAYRGIIPQEFLDSIPEGRWADRVECPGRENLVCTVDGEIIGTISFCGSRFEHLPEAGEIVAVYLLPEYIGMGFGREMITAALKALFECGYRQVFLWVLEENAAARGFYEKMGFELTNDRFEDNIGGKVLRELRYVYRFDKEGLI